MGVISVQLLKKMSYKRAIIISVIFAIMFSSCIYKIYDIQNSELSSVADMQFSKQITLGTTRGYIYDINMKPLVNDVKEYRAILISSEITASLINNKEIEEIKDGIYLKINSDNELEESEFVKNFTLVNRYSDEQLCSHIIGYTDSDGKGVCGIEKAFDKILTDNSGKLLLNFNADASGNALYGNGIELINENYDSSGGIRLTINKNIQNIAENVLKSSDITCGAIVILDVETAEIRAISSIPCYDVNNVGASLDNVDKPFLNRAFCAYPVGSVFKPFIAAAAIKNGYSISANYDCKGYINIGENVFTCYNNTVHKTEDLNLAIENSCNTFFIDMGIKTNAQNIIETASLFGFGKKTELCSTLISDAGNLPSYESITSDSELANLCFGQGSLLATPLQMAAAYNVFANNGVYKEPSVLKELINSENEAYAYYRSENSYVVIDEDICDTINVCLYNNMLNGTGVNAAPENVTSAGKTATAQTGRYDENGEEILCTWFAGFFPYDDPQYTIVVFNENGSTASADCAPVFKRCAEEIMKLN